MATMCATELEISVDELILIELRGIPSRQLGWTMEKCLKEIESNLSIKNCVQGFALSAAMDSYC
jgi:hypothetical protein